MALLDVQNLGVSFVTRNGTNKAVDDISFTVEAGQITAIIGESGSGKSVACYSLLGLIPQPPGRIDSGTALFGERDLLKLSEAKLRQIRGRDIAMIFQDPMTSLNPYMTVGRQLMEPLRYHRKVSRQAARQRALELLEEVGIRDPLSTIDNFPHQFSGGMRQRVIVAIALASNPKLVIADEPTTALDVTIQSQILKLMKRLVKEHRTAMILITHDLAVVSEMTDKIMVMYCGRIVEKGTRNDIINRCRHPYTIGLLGSIPKLVSRQKRLFQIPGMVPNIMNLPPGCSFAPRCDYAKDRCRTVHPELADIEPGHETAGYYPVER